MTNETKQKYQCSHAKDNRNGLIEPIERGTVICDISLYGCPYVLKVFSFKPEIVGDMRTCPAYDLSNKLTAAIKMEMARKDGEEGYKARLPDSK